MFGDVMHGVLLTIFAIWLCWTKREPGSLAGTLGAGRYMFLLMGLFAAYNGLIYNDFTSASLELFGRTCFTKTEVSIENPHHIWATRPSPEEDPEGAECVYPFGMDPIWFRST
jgi:V-type H+-transporting ATPase subunit a